MRPRFASVSLYAAVASAIGGAYGAGLYVGRHEASDALIQSLVNVDAERAAETFLVLNSARRALRESDPVRAETVLVRFAAVKVPTLRECSMSEACAAWLGQHLPTQTELEAAVAAEAALPRK
jgi:hypothetical protein